VTGTEPAPRVIAVVPAREKDEARELVPAIRAWLREHGCETRTEDDLRAGGRADVLVALGGDGLMMRMAHSFPNLPLLGINFGKVGFLAMVERAQWQDVLGSLLGADFRVLDGPTLAAGIRRGHSRIDGGWAINDVVLRAGLRMIEVELYVDGHYVNTYPGDGMIVASPQGSTAYCMAAGGPIITAGVRGFALTPISAHSPIRATLVVPEESTIELVLTNDHAAELIMDGLPVEHLRLGDVLTVTRGAERFRLIVTSGMNFYEAFRSKFNYLIRPDAVPSLGVVRQEH
jgi:NAD+ kinase